eukprot:1144301-Pelagomonas_calceolata.AAC.1
MPRSSRPPGATILRESDQVGDLNGLFGTIYEPCSGSWVAFPPQKGGMHNLKYAALFCAHLAMSLEGHGSEAHVCHEAWRWQEMAWLSTLLLSKFKVSLVPIF